jgi:hypothetical protein
MTTTLATTFDSLVTAVLHVQRKTEALVNKLHYINSDVHGVFGTPDLETIQETLAELQLDLPELTASAALPLAACAPFAAEVERLSSEEDTLNGSDVTATDSTRVIDQTPGTALASAEVIAGTHQHASRVLAQTDDAVP